MANLIAYAPAAFGGMIFFIGMTYVYAQRGHENSAKIVNVSWLSLGLAITYIGALAYAKVGLTMSSTAKLICGVSVCSLAMLAPVQFLAKLLFALGKSPLEVSDDIINDGAIDPSDRVQSAKQRASQSK